MVFPMMVHVSFCLIPRHTQNIQQRIHLANQDNWINPSFETAHLVTEEAAAKTR